MCGMCACVLMHSQKILQYNIIIHWKYLVFRSSKIHLTQKLMSYKIFSGALAKADIHQLNLIMEILGTPRDEFMKKISSESVSCFNIF